MPDRRNEHSWTSDLAAVKSGVERVHADAQRPHPAGQTGIQYQPTDTEILLTALAHPEAVGLTPADVKAVEQGIADLMHGVNAPSFGVGTAAGVLHSLAKKNLLPQK